MDFNRDTERPSNLSRHPCLLSFACPVFHSLTRPNGVGADQTEWTNWQDCLFAQAIRKERVLLKSDPDSREIDGVFLRTFGVYRADGPPVFQLPSK